MKQHYEFILLQNVQWLLGGFRSVSQNFNNDYSNNDNCTNENYVHVHVHENIVPPEPNRSYDPYLINYHEETKTFTYKDPWHSHENAMANPDTNETPTTTSVTQDINQNSGDDSKNSFTEQYSQPEPASATNSQAQVHETQPFHQEVKEVSP